MRKYINIFEHGRFDLDKEDYGFWDMFEPFADDGPWLGIYNGIEHLSGPRKSKFKLQSQVAEFFEERYEDTVVRKGEMGHYHQLAEKLEKEMIELPRLATVMRLMKKLDAQLQNDMAAGTIMTVDAAENSEDFQAVVRDSDEYSKDPHSYYGVSPKDFM